MRNNPTSLTMQIRTSLKNYIWNLDSLPFGSFGLIQTFSDAKYLRPFLLQCNQGFLTLYVFKYAFLLWFNNNYIFIIMYQTCVLNTIPFSRNYYDATLKKPWKYNQRNINLSISYLLLFISSSWSNIIDIVTVIVTSTDQTLLSYVTHMSFKC